MDLLVKDPWLIRDIICDRRERGIDRRDEVWDGVNVIYSPSDIEHQELIGGISFALYHCLNLAKLGAMRSGMAVSDRESQWRKNFRCPDVMAVLNKSTAINKGSHWFGGPDFLAEIISRNDLSREKMSFYAKLGVKELLLVDRKPWALELYRLQDGALALVGKSDLSNPAVLVSGVVPLSFQLLEGDPRPSIVMTHSDGVQRWSA